MIIDRNSVKILSISNPPEIWNPRFGPDDTIYGGAGIDVIHAGDGKDTVYGGGERDFIFGEAGNDRLYGEAGTDYLYGGDGDDALDGGTGSDRLDGGSGADRMAGGADSDLYYVDDIGDAVVENAGEGANDEVISYLDSYVLPDNVEHLYLQGQALDGDGNALNNRIFGNAEGNWINGFDGHDDLRGFDGADVISGGDGNDRIWGGAGRDEMTGGMGADIFVFMYATDASNATGGGRDVITDFNRSEGDQIELPFDSDWTIAGNQDFEFIGDQAFTAPGQVRVVQDAMNLQTFYVYLNMDNDQSYEATFVIELAPGELLAPTEDWFVL